MEILNIIAGIVLVVLVAYGSIVSSIMVSEKKERQRKGLTDYYDNPINKD